jgi:hypothetical protein
VLAALGLGKETILMQGLDNASLVDAQVVSFNLNEKIERLTTIADWKDELRRMIAAALDDPTADLDWLKTEVMRFRLACKGAR